MLTKAIGNFFDQLGAEWVLWLLVALSVLSVAVMIERAIFLGRNRVDVNRLTERVLAALRVGGGPAAVEVVAGAPGMIGAVLRSAFEAYQDGVGAVEEVVLAGIGRERLRYDRFLSILGTLANNAPFIGLFGTVIGIINAFGQLAGALEGTSRTEMVMASISEALVATAMGLAVAIPAVIAYNYFKGRTKEAATRAEATARLILAHLKADARGATQPGL